MSKYIPPELMKKAKEMDLLTYLKNYEPNELVKVSNNEYTTKTHDSLRISNGLWNWCSAGIGGKNAMDYLERVCNIPYPKTAEIVLGKMQIQTPIYVEKQEKKQEKKLILPEKYHNENRVKEYLKSRGIDEEIIEKCIKNKLIYEEKYYHNVVFLGYDENKIPRYAGCRSTDERNFKNDATGSNKAYSFKLESQEKTDTIFIFEGAIDVLSYATFFKLYGQKWENKTMISLAGVYQPSKIIEESKIPLTIKNYLENHKEIKRIILCLDNDSAGRKATKALKTVLSKQYEILDRPPKYEKDYNDYLCKFLGINRTKNTEKVIKERNR